MTEAVEDAPIEAAQIDALWDMLCEETEAYRSDFFPFATREAFGKARSEAKRDIYRALLRKERLIGYFMLRGWDLGYTRPSFGVYVSSVAAGQGVGNFALDRACALAQDAGASEIFLKVAETNAKAVALYRRAGFRENGRCEDTQHLTMVRTLVR